MKVQIFTMYDKKMQIHHNPVYSVNRGTMMRQVQDTLQRNPDTLMARFPVDYELYLIGEFDDIKGKIEVLPEKEYICMLEDLVVSEDKKL